MLLMLVKFYNKKEHADKMLAGELRAGRAQGVQGYGGCLFASLGLTHGPRPCSPHCRARREHRPSPQFGGRRRHYLFAAVLQVQECGYQTQ